MNLIVLDFETFYSEDYTLKKLSTEDYVDDPRFEIMGVGAKINDAKPIWFSGTHKEIASWLRGIGLWDAGMIAHNTMFDALILQKIFGKLPPLLFDTMAMAQPFLRPFTRSVSLENCATLLKLPEKGSYVQHMKGRPRQSLSKDELAEYGRYCMNDCEVEYQLFKRLRHKFTADELRIIDLTLRMYLQPVFELDAGLLAEHLQHVIAVKQAQMAQLPPHIGKEKLVSNEQFAVLLGELGVLDIPTKISKVTGLEAFAFNKTDTGWKELEENYADDPLVSAVLAARIGAKSSIEETRSQRLLDIANRHVQLRVPLTYYSAHTGRYGGGQKINLQNLPQTGKSKLRFALKAPEGYVVLAADLAQIEARILACFAKQLDLVQAFRDGVDVYSDFATVLYHQEVVKGRSKQDDQRRFIGKTCILALGYGTGHVTLQNSLRKADIKVTKEEARRMVDTYRLRYPSIQQLWARLDRMLLMLANRDQQSSFATLDPVQFSTGMVLLPNSMPLVYNNTHYRTRTKYASNKIQLDQPAGWVYEFGGETRNIYGAKLAENIVQALARIIIMDNMVEVHRRHGLRPALQIHDELDYVVPENEAEDWKQKIAAVMTRAPAWMPELPLAVEITCGKSLGDCK